MIYDGMKFEDALRLAQKLGYAEKDPTADVEGHDACRKICIISSLVYGKHVYPDSVHTEGISDIKLEDVQIVNKWGGSIKLIAKVSAVGNGKILPIVMPMIVPFDNLISRVDDVFNAVLISGDAIDKTLFYGRGAGKLPTASAVLGDVIDSVKHDKTVFSQSWEPAEDNSFIEDWHNFKAPVYFRVEKPENILDIIKNFEKINGIAGQTSFITSEMTLNHAYELKEKLEANGADVVSMIPVLK
mgnify:FL=1